MKIFTTAIFAVAVLKRAITRKQWFSLGVLFVGVCLVQLKQSEKRTISSENPFLGKDFVTYDLGRMKCQFLMTSRIQFA